MQHFKLHQEFIASVMQPVPVFVLFLTSGWQSYDHFLNLFSKPTYSEGFLTAGEVKALIFY